jgi:cell division transport system ATP-binding protein
VAKPELLLADEPTGNVDPDIGGRIMRLFIELNRLGTSILIATHDQRIIERLAATKVLKLSEGRLSTTNEPAPVEAMRA